MKTLHHLIPRQFAIITLLLLGSLLLRLHYLPLITVGDMPTFIYYIRRLREPHLQALLASDFTKLSTAYLYLWLPFTFLPVRPVFIIKGCSLFFDYICAWYGYRLVTLHYRHKKYLCWAAALTLLYTPVLVMDASIWGQLDSTYTAFLLASVYYLLRLHSDQAKPRDRILSMLCFCIALGFKLQAALFLPALCFFFARKTFPWYYASMPVVTHLLLYVPRLLIGFPASHIFAGYGRQIDANDMLHNASYNAANLQNLLYINGDMYYYFGLCLGALVCAAGAILGRQYRNKDIAPPNLLLLCTTALLISPYVLPHMLPRYYLPANLLIIILAFYDPRRWLSALAFNISLAICYLPYLHVFMRTKAADNNPWVNGLVSGIVIMTAWRFYQQFRTNRAASPPGK